MSDRKRPAPAPVPVDEAVFLTLGVPAGERGQRAIRRALSALKHAGFSAAVSSPEAIAAAAQANQAEGNGQGVAL